MSADSFLAGVFPVAAAAEFEKNSSFASSGQQVRPQEIAVLRVVQVPKSKLLE
jgi:hypothetical protein